MTAYEEFINGGSQYSLCRLFQLEINGNPDNLIDFCNEFLETKGIIKTSTLKTSYGIHAVYNDKYIFEGAMQEGSKLAIRLAVIPA
jgi:hypothetical protein